MTVEQRLTPKQKRELKQEIKKADEIEKKVRLLSRPEFQPIPRMQEGKDSDNYPRAHEDPGSIMQKLMEWDHIKADTTGEWSWGQERLWHVIDWEKTIHPSLCRFQNLTWAEIYKQRTGGKKRHKKHHDMDLFNITKEAVDRWLELGLDEYETLFRFKLGNDPRLWGFRVYTKFFVVWWDKLHKIYPLEAS